MSTPELPSFAEGPHSKYTTPPNPTFTYGQNVDATEAGRAWLEGEKAGWKVIDASTEDTASLYKIMISGIVPRPIAFVSSIAADGTENIAPFSFFNMVSQRPPLISISAVTKPHLPDVEGGLKDTAANIKGTKGFTVNIISEPFVENANISCMDTPHDVSEWPLTGLTKEPSIHVKAPRVKESAFSLECELFQAIDIHDAESHEHTTMLILGLVKYIHIRQDVLSPRGVVDVTKLRPVARAGDITYTRVGDAFRLPRPAWADEAEKIQAALGGGGARAAL